jgi:nucleoside-diphosphate-sugar epimerase
MAAAGIPLPFGLLRGQRNLLSVWNFVDFLRTCAIHPVPLNETFLVADAQPITLPEIFRHLGKGMNKKQYLLPVPRFALAGLCRLLGKAQMLRKVDSELLVSVDKAVSLLNWTQPYTTQAALARAGEEFMKGRKL